MKTAIAIGLALIVLLAALSGAGYYLTHNVDWARIYYKRFKAANEFVFEEISPQLKETDPAKLIRIRTTASAERIRGGLIKAIWGSAEMPLQVLPAPFTGALPGRLDAIRGVRDFRKLRMPMDLGYAAYVYVMEPAKPNGRLVVYQHGYAGTVESMAPLFERLLAQGYTVAASNYPEYGPNLFPRQHLDRFGWYTMSHDRFLSIHPQPLRFYIEPIVVLLNAMQNEYDRIDMVGFSAGGWIATVAAAVDRRISRTITVAGGYPIYLRVMNFERESPPPQFYQPLLQAANYLEMYVLAAAGEARSLTQIFNRYDRCCYRNTYARLYEEAVRESALAIGSGGFRVFIDESHADHKVSEWAMERITETLAAPR